MRRVLTICALTAGIVMMAPVSNAKSQPRQYQQATVLKVEKQEMPDPLYAGTNPTDMPLRADVYAYDLSVRVNCGTYVGHYESPTEYIPTAFTPNNHIQVRLTKHVMYVDLPGEKEMPMSIVGHRNEPGPCNQLRQ